MVDAKNMGKWRRGVNYGSESTGLDSPGGVDASSMSVGQWRFMLSELFRARSNYVYFSLSLSEPQPRRSVVRVIYKAERGTWLFLGQPDIRNNSARGAVQRSLLL